MMGHSHALSGAAAWLALAGPVATAAGYPQSTGTVLAGAIACAGAALVPDLDHPNGTAAHFFGWFSEQVAKLVAWLSGGHRHGTHTLAFCVLAGGGVLALQQWAPHAALLIVMAVLVGLGLRGLAIAPPGTGKHLAGLVIAAEAGVAVWLLDEHVHGSWPWIAPAVMLGCVVHIAGDALTTEGVRPWKPFSNTWVGFPLIRRTGNWVEHRIAVPLMTISCAALLLLEFYPSYLG